MLDGSPPCSPQMPSLMSGRVLRPFSTAIFMSWPTPTVSIEAKGLALDDFLGLVGRQEAAAVVAAHAQRHLREIVRAETEELGGVRDLIGRQRTARELRSSCRRCT